MFEPDSEIKTGEVVMLIKKEAVGEISTESNEAVIKDEAGNEVKFGGAEIPEGWPSVIQWFFRYYSAQGYLLNQNLQFFIINCKPKTKYSWIKEVKFGK